MILSAWRLWGPSLSQMTTIGLPTPYMEDNTVTVSITVFEADHNLSIKAGITWKKKKKSRVTPKSPLSVNYGWFLFM